MPDDSEGDEMKRNIFLFALILLVAAYGDAKAETSILAGVTRFATPGDGLYWNKNQENKMDLNSFSYGIRWESEPKFLGLSVAAQYINFGTAKTNAMAVTRDAPLEGGYIEGAERCVGPCAPLKRWVMRTEAQAIGISLNKYWGGFGLEWGAGYFNTKTNGQVINDDGSVHYNYAEGLVDGLTEFYGIAYRSGRFAVRLQKWTMPGRPISRDSEGTEKAPSIMGNADNWALFLQMGF